jgi:hypothetical protein
VGSCGKNELALLNSVLLSLSAVFTAIHIGPSEMIANKASTA